MPAARALLLAVALLAAAGCELIVHPDEVAPPTACQPKSCAEQGKDCGDVDDGCGATLPCGECQSPEVCGGGGVDNVCAPCKPRCSGRDCGPDGCGGKCGTCSAAEVCDVNAGQCVGCRTDADCAATPSAPRCEPGSRTCVACLSAGDCDPSGKIACDTATHSCQAACKTDPDCAAVTGAPRCDPATFQCVACLAEGDCAATPARPHCLVAEKACVACRDGADCAAGTANFCRADHSGCVGCLGDADCAGERCEPTKGVCVQCLSAADCAAPAPRCSADGACVECTGPADCASGTCNADGTCVPVGTPGDTCASPIPLSFASGVASATGDTTAFADDTTTASCGGGGPDVVYKIVLGATQDVDVVVWPEVDTFRPAVAVRSTCADASTAAELACGKSRASGEPAAATLDNLPAGTYYVWVDGFYTSKGAYSLSVTLRPSTSTVPDSCSKARALAFDAAGSAYAAGDTSGLVDDESGSCGGASAPDVAYGLTLSQPRSLDAIVSSLDLLDVYAPALYLTDGCTLPTELVCDAATLGPGAARVLYPRLEAGSYVLWVDGANASSGSFALWVGLGEPVNDTCADAVDLAFDAAGKAQAQGSTLIASDDASSEGCGGTGADVFYKLTVPAGATVTAKVTPSAASSGYDPVVYLRSTCATASTELTCQHGAGKVLTASSLAAGTYWLIVDGYAGTTGDFTLDVTRL